MESLIYYLVWAGLFLLMMRFGCGKHVLGHQHGRHSSPSSNEQPNADDIRWEAPETDTDPVCGKTVHTAHAKSTVYDGAVFYFCSRECRELFEAAPHLYRTDGAAKGPESVETSHA